MLNNFTDIYVFIQILAFLFVVVFLILRKDRAVLVNTAATILTVFGVLGTFIGIYMGLDSFNTDPENMQNSIVSLLEGLKLAFKTSIYGIGSAFLLKLFALIFTKANQSSKSIEQFVTSLTDTMQNVQTSGEINLLAQLVTLNKTIEKEGSETRSVLSNIKNDLTNIDTSITTAYKETLTGIGNISKTVGDKHNDLITFQREEGVQYRQELTNIQTAFIGAYSSLQSELGNLTITFSNKQDMLIDEFNTFSKNVAESVAKLATDELIDALKTVIEEFNTKISEQFGDNFKQLNEAVGKTVTWQEQYRVQMEELADEFRIAADGIEKSRESVEKIADSSNTIADRSENIVFCTEKLDPILHTLNDQLEAFSELRQKALDAFPLIEGQLTELTNGFSTNVQTAITESHDSVEVQREALTEHTNNLQTTVKTTTQDLTKLSTSFAESVETSIANSHESMNQQQTELISRFRELENATGTVSQQFQKTIDDIGSNLDEVFEKSADHINKLTDSFTQDLTQKVENTINNITKGFSDTVTNAIADSQTSMEKQRTALDEHTTTLQSTITEIAQQVDSIINDVSTVFTGSQSSMEQQRQYLVELTQHLQTNFNKFEETLEIGLTTSLEALAGKLAALSEKFVDDYTPLTEALHDLVNIASNNQAERNIHF